MAQLLFSSETYLFTLAIFVMLALALLEVVGMVFGLSLSGLVDDVLPDLDIDADVDMDADVSVDAVGLGPVDGFLAWLAVGKVPFIVLLIILLTSFGIIGVLIQYTAASVIGSSIPFWMALIPTVIVSFWFTATTGHAIGRIMPKEETDARSRNNLVGEVAVLTLGNATMALQAEARVTDNFGTRHYVQVIPDQPDITLMQGDEVLLVGLKGSLFTAIANPHKNLSPRPDTLAD
ncbi:Inner membrane protein YqiJ [Pseudovibrio sp. Ad46]|uniref:OB-fold-containig protein n=1 Tax=unclassified Pseudovibrio TaxID=2627060 RepID=UPI0007AE583A|nr:MULTISPECIES: OB-fold-containig protein [unclassified Pseudovibrio]KZK77302.1 Inner membrane protein YqiJ [Pseudovibrio sp. Ad46]KZK89795.1 Inner membrane protein YqiJ [Pseudovibrio sp. Ad5]